MQICPSPSPEQCPLCVTIGNQRIRCNRHKVVQFVCEPVKPRRQTGRGA